LEHGFGGLDIPVAVLAPEEAVERGGGVAEAVFFQSGADFGDGGIEPQENPFVVDDKSAD
jgi:hypothetical protein